MARNPTWLLVVAALIRDEAGRILLQQALPGKPHAGQWEFPGGKVETGESPENALHRELREELGIGVVLGAELEAPGPAGWPLNERAAMRVWFAEVADGDPRPLEDHDELRWISIRDGDEALSLPWIPADVPIVRALLASVAASSSAGSVRGN